MKWWHYGLIGLALFAVGFGVGRLNAPTKTVEIDRTAELDMELTQRLRELTAKLDQYKTRETTTTFTPAGKPATRVTREETRTRADAAAHESLEVTHEKVRVEVREKIVERAQPGWSVGVIALATPTTIQPFSVDFSIGATISRRILGPFWLGLTATVPVKQPLTIPTVGLSLTASF